MLKKICWILGCCWFFLLYPVYAEGIVVAVPREVHVTGSQLTLGDIAEVSGDGEARIASLRQIRLGSMPTPGNSIVLTKEALGERLVSSGADLNGITWEIPEAISIIADGQVISRQLLVDKSVAAIQSLSGMPMGSPDLKVTLESNVRDVTVAPGQSEITVSLPNGIRYTGNTNVQALISVNGKLSAKLTLRFDVKLFRQVVVAARQIAAKEVLTSAALRLERLDVGRVSGSYYTQTDKVAGLAVRRALVPGTPIADTMLEKPVVIKRGKTVSIRARIGALEVSAAGQAMQDGVEGQFIRVKNITTGRVVSGKVIDDSTVETGR